MFFGLTIAIKAQNPAFTQSTVVSGLTYPVAFDIAPDGRFFVTQKGGNTAGSCANALIKVFSQSGASLGNFYNLTDSVQCDFERGLLGICFDPNFNNNHFVYVYYNHRWLGDERIRVIKFTEVNNVGTNPQIILDIDVSNSINGNHVGGNIRMHSSEPDKIYISIGDIAVQANGQTKGDPYGSFLRINTDGTIPNDNPYYDDGNPATGNDDRIWTYGHRNAFDFNFSAVNDSLYSTENGLNTWDEVNMIHKGKNYGWNTCEGFYNQGSTSVNCSLAGSELPIEDWAAPLPAITGILHYSGTAFSTLTNHLLVSDNDFGRIYDITLGNAPAYDQFISRTQWADFTTSGGLTTLMQGSDECIYAMKGGYTTAGAIYRICPLGMETVQSSFDFQNLTVYPNPTNENIELNFYLNETSEVYAEFYDISGRCLIKTESERLNSGKSNLKFNLKKLLSNSGIYFCRLNSKKGESVIQSGVFKIILE
jgi:glucose/arabinose dehydrogenase